MTDIRVNTSTLKSRANEFTSKGTQINTLMRQMLQKVQKLNTGWTGSAATRYIAKFTALQEDMERIVKMCTEHGTDLQTIASNYIQYDEQGAELANGLSSNVIV